MKIVDYSIPLQNDGQVSGLSDISENQDAYQNIPEFVENSFI